MRRGGEGERLTTRGCAPSPMTSSLPSGCTHSGQWFRRGIGTQLMLDAPAASSVSLSRRDAVRRFNRQEAL